jgi:hypothetical protein
MVGVLAYGCESSDASPDNNDLESGGPRPIDSSIGLTTHRGDDWQLNPVLMRLAKVKDVFAPVGLIITVQRMVLATG